jgi:GNAT superfamily N-acetyltransferase
MGYINAPANLEDRLRSALTAEQLRHLTMLVYYDERVEDFKNLRLEKIKVADNFRCKGLGTLVMRILCEYADARRTTVFLTPSGDLGGNVTRLRRFYATFGFREVRSFEFPEVMETHVREPK